MDPTLSPVKGLARALGVRPEEVTLKGVFDHVKSTQCALRMQHYSTQNEADIGKMLLADVGKSATHDDSPAVSQLEVPPLEVPMLAEEEGEEKIIELPPDLSISSSMQEDTHVNAPLFNHLSQHHVHPLMQLLLTVNRSAFIDGKGREQRADMVLLNSLFLEWPHVVTMFEGKLDLIKDFHEALGQARRRAAAILGAQPWRERVDIILYDLESIAIFRLDCEGFNCLTAPIDFLRHVSGHKYACLYGYYLLLDYLKYPGKLGFTRHPLRLTRMQNLMGPGVTSELVCGRSEGKAVFVMNVGDTKIIAKVFVSEEAAERERSLLAQVQGIEGTAQLHPSCVLETLQCDIAKNGSRQCDTWFGFAVLPYCSVLVPSHAEPFHFASVAQTILATAAIGLVCNDISLDNLLLTETSNVIISDWGLATSPGAHIGSRGKHLFIPPSCRLEDGGVDPERVAAVRNDLYALLLVAVSCALADVPWACAKTDADMKDKMLHACGLGKLRGPSSVLATSKKWSYLLQVAKVLEDAKQSDEQVVAMFDKFC